jgi:Flp pilus assembly protein TadB
MNAINLVAAIFGGAGVYLIFTGFTGNLFLSSGKRSLQGTNERASRTYSQARIEAVLYQARAPISYAEFMATSLAIGILIAAAFFFITRGLLVTVVALLSGTGVYYLYLIDRRDRIRIEYEKVQPEVADIIAAAFRSRGYNLPAVLNQVIESGPEVAREDWIRLAAAFESRHLDDRAISQVLEYRNSPGLWRIVEALRLFRDDLERLAPLMEKIKRDLSQEVAIEREIVTEMVGPRKQLMYVAMMPTALLVIFILFSPEIGAFYASLVGQIVMIAVLGASALIYALGVRAANNKMRLRQASVTGFGGKMAEVEVQETDPSLVGLPAGDNLFEHASEVEQNWPVDTETSSEGLSDRDFLR